MTVTKGMEMMKRFLAAIAILFFISSNGYCQQAKQPLKKHRPNYTLATKFIPIKSVFSMNEPLTVTVEIKNVGTLPVTFQIRNNEDLFHFEASAPTDAVLNNDMSWKTRPQVVNYMGGPHTLKPGEVFTYWDNKIDLRKWLTFQKAGTYSIQGSYCLYIYDLGRKYDPARDVDFIIWQEDATAEFSLKIE